MQPGTIRCLVRDTPKRRLKLTCIQDVFPRMLCNSIYLRFRQCSFFEWFREEEAWKIKVAPGCPRSPTTNMPQTKIFCETGMHPEWALGISCFSVLLLKWAQSGCCKIRLHLVCIFSRLCVNRCCTVGGIFVLLFKTKIWRPVLRTLSFRRYAAHLPFEKGQAQGGKPGLNHVYFPCSPPPIFEQGQKVTREKSS